ncbi:hypothetical protein E1A91_A08G076300v1 [Gossypium mustelinum]|uniref:FLZ-type domain-containing protein n=2 Tax=Gossypium mustelinum TaxID=34275 RepID=A0A5D2Y5L8_GOSMU|nr:hypothetical protein E1A91_A08G076300v1 [Gossypium mustelinum]
MFLSNSCFSSYISDKTGKVMLRNRSRAVTSKQQPLMADHSSQSSSLSQNHTTPIPSFFGSPRFKAFTTKCLPDTEPVVLKSPTSILDNNKPLFTFGNLFGFDLNQSKSPKTSISLNNKRHHTTQTSEPKGVGLAIVDTLNDKPTKDNKVPPKTSNNKVLFGTKLRVQIPFNWGVPVKEMELSEDYTCVKSHGPNPKTTHIYGSCVVKSYCSSVLDELKCAAESDFLSFCHTCKKNLEQKIDIYIYRGEKAFCSQECRYQEMVLDGEEK